MRIVDQAKSIQIALNDWAVNNNGISFIASDLAHLWKLAWSASDKVKAIICYMGEDIRGDFSVAAALGRVDRQWTVVITRGRGFNANRGDSLTETMQNAAPLYELVDQARDLIRVMINASNELPVDFKTIRTMQTGDVIMDAYMIEFSLATDLNPIVQQPSDMVAIPL